MSSSQSESPAKSAKPRTHISHCALILKVNSLIHESNLLLLLRLLLCCYPSAPVTTIASATQKDILLNLHDPARLIHETLDMSLSSCYSFLRPLLLL